VKKKKHLTVSLPNTVFFLLKANVSQQQLLCSVVQQQINGEASSHVSNYFQVLLLKQSLSLLSCTNITTLQVTMVPDMADACLR
jgi:hypothetical protein